MLSRPFELTLPRCTVEEVRARAEPYADRRWKGLWIHVEADGRLRARARVGDRLMAEGVLRGQVVASGDDVVLRGRMRWGNLLGATSIYVVCALAILAMGIGYRNGVVLVAAAAPAVLTGMLLRLVRRGQEEDPDRLAGMLTRALGRPQGPGEQSPWTGSSLFN